VNISLVALSYPTPLAVRFEETTVR